MEISVVIPTFNRKQNLLSLLRNLEQSSFCIHEVIIVDGGNDSLSEEDCLSFQKLKVRHLHSVPSVCIQRNMGIQTATSEWIFLCDDDMEVPTDYLEKIKTHIHQHPEAGAVSGLVMQKEKEKWVSSYPVHSSKELLLKYIFGLSIWGEISCSSDNYFIKRIKRFYTKKGNFIAKSGFPVITDFSGSYFIVPVYGIGAGVIRKQWLENASYDEVLDKNGIGDNYGVAMGFPDTGIHVIKDAFVYHHHEQTNRIQQPILFYRRMLSLDYFIQINRTVNHVKRRYLIWSVLGSFSIYRLSKNKQMASAAFKTLVRLLKNKNPYLQGALQNQKTIEPVL